MGSQLNARGIEMDLVSADRPTATLGYSFDPTSRNLCDALKVSSVCRNGSISAKRHRFAIDLKHERKPLWMIFERII